MMLMMMFGDVGWLRSIDGLWKKDVADQLARDCVFFGLPALSQTMCKWREGCRLLVPSAAFPTISSACEGHPTPQRCDCSC